MRTYVRVIIVSSLYLLWAFAGPASASTDAAASAHDNEVSVEDLPDHEFLHDHAPPPPQPNSVRSLFEGILREDRKGRRSSSWSQCQVIKDQLSHPVASVSAPPSPSTAVEKTSLPCGLGQQLRLNSNRQVIAESDPLVVSTLDGALHAISPDTGESLWTIKNDPVLKMPAEAKNHVVNMLPNPKDGSLYVVNNGAGGGSESIRKLPFTIPELVSASPTRSSDGILYMGRKIDRWIALDSRTGFRVDVPAENDELSDDQDGVCPFDLNNGVLIGRSEYTISMMDSKKRGTRTAWNVTFFDYAAVDLPDEDEYDLFHFTSSSGGRLLSVHRSTGVVKHERDFGEHPIVAVYSLRPDGMFRVPFTTVAPETLESLGERLGKSATDFAKRKSDLYQTLYVGQWSDGLYAVPSFVDESIVTIRSLPEPVLPPLLEGPSTPNPVEGGKRDDFLFETSRDKVEPFMLLGYYEVGELPLITYERDNSKLVESPWTDEERVWRNSKVVNGTDGKKEDEVRKADEENRTAEVKFEREVWLFGWAPAVFTCISAVLALLVLVERWRLGWEVNRSRSRSSTVAAANVDASSISGVEESDDKGGVKIGKITFYPNEVIGRGCEGTCVFPGVFDNRRVAVKRLLPECIQLAECEVNLLRESDQHPNVVRYFCTEQGPQFRYIALELCAATLQDYVRDGRCRGEIEPYDVVRQSAAGLKHLHDLNIVHRDVKPQNVLLSLPSAGHPRVRAILSDFGLSKKIKGGRTSCSHNSGTPGTDGWIAPEMLRGDGRTTQKVDVFSLGCVIYYVLTGGEHPFGDPFHRQANIVTGRHELEADFGPAFNRTVWLHLIRAMINADGSKRPKLSGVLSHPAFWRDGETLHFFQDVSDRVEKDDESSPIVRSLEDGARAVVGSDWRSRLEPEIAEDLRKFRSYRGHSIRDLLRALRNKKHHYRELTPEAQRILGDIPDQFADYWLRKFPGLLLHVWSRAAVLKGESVFRRYYEDLDFSFELPTPPLPRPPPAVVERPPPPTEPVILPSQAPVIVEKAEDGDEDEGEEAGTKAVDLRPATPTRPLEWRRGMNGSSVGVGVNGDAGGPDPPPSPAKSSVNQRGKNKYRNAKKRQSAAERRSRSDRENWRERSCERECAVEG